MKVSRNVGVWRVLLVLPLYLWGSALAQTPSENDDITAEFGFGGELIADDWNPLRVTMRDQDAAELVLELDVGNLRQGSKRLRYSAALTGGAGLYTFEDDIFIPTWRAFSWQVRTPDEVLASGSLERRRADPKPLQLVLARDVSDGNRYFVGGQRIIDVLPEELPERAAAYGGVASLLVLPSTRPPTAAAVTAATTAGVTVVLVGPLGTAYREVLALAQRPVQRFGMGWLIRVPSTQTAAVQQGLAYTGLEPKTLLPALIAPELTRTPPNPSVVLVLAALGAYVLLTALLLRFGRVPGLLATLLLAAVLSLGARQLRPETLLLTRSRTLSIGAGELALEFDLETLFSYPTQTARLPYPLYPLDLGNVQRWSVGPETLNLELPRYESVALFGKPRLALATLGWDGEALVNLGDRSLGNVFSEASGVQPALPAGTVAELRNGNLIPPELYTSLLPLLPPGSAIARDGGTFYVALPETAGAP